MEETYIEAAGISGIRTLLGSLSVKWAPYTIQTSRLYFVASLQSMVKSKM